jgi:hypothetical protein
LIISYFKVMYLICKNFIHLVIIKLIIINFFIITEAIINCCLINLAIFMFNENYMAITRGKIY